MWQDYNNRGSFIYVLREVSKSLLSYFLPRYQKTL